MKALKRSLLMRVSRVALLLLLPISTASAEQVTVKLWNGNIHDKKYQQKMYKLFENRHPDIKIEYTSISLTVYGQVLEAAFLAKDPPDIFHPGGNLTFQSLRAKNLIKPLNEVAPNEKELKEWMAQFPPQLHSFVEGVNVFDGKPYTIDLEGAKGAPGGYPLFYNKTLFREAGISKPPDTYSELRQTAAKVTQAGQGKYFGIVHGPKLFGIWIIDVTGMARVAGAQGLFGPPWHPDYRDGRYHNYGPELMGALKVWMGMREDESVFPGVMNMEDEQAKMIFATNKAAMQFGYWWNPGNYLAYNSEVEFDCVPPPAPDSGIRKGYSYAISSMVSAKGYVVSALTEHPEAVWEVIKFISSLEYQEGYVKGGFGISYLPAANKPENYTVPTMYKFAQWAVDPAYWRIGPPLSETAFRVVDAMPPGVYPSWTDVTLNIYQGNAGFETLKDLDKKLDASLDEAIAKAQEQGMKITRSDYTFPDWDPTKDYVPKKK